MDRSGAESVTAAPVPVPRISHGRFALNLLTGQWTGDEDLCEVLGLGGWGSSKQCSIPRFAHDDDRPRLEQVLQHAAATGAPYSCEFRLVRADGVLRHVMLTGESRRASSGTPQLLRGVLTDVSQRHEIEQRWAEVVARALEDQAEPAGLLHRSALQPHLPRVPGAEVTARYLSATRGARLGGDFYDVRMLTDRTLSLTIGDVTGHGVQAAADMSRLVTLFRAFASDDGEPAHVLRLVNTLLPQVAPKALATAVYATLDLERRQLSWARAGHPPAVLIGPDGPSLLDEQPSLMLGVNPQSPYADVTVELPAPATVLFYTDGLIERHHRSLDAGTDRLLKACAACAEGPERLCDELLRELEAVDRDDDICLVAVTLP
ncbi:MAG TPA: SpoIIE family protein phosphatase [Mycobacteriales bacterium]|nr:SpoIIE family protein phosphatase [Mycobacteriales bacterium]